jgi:hypothetical protein
MNIKELEQKISSFWVDYERKNQRLIHKKHETDKDIIEYSYNEGFKNALVLVIHDLRKLDNRNEYKGNRR